MRAAEAIRKPISLADEAQIAAIIEQRLGLAEIEQALYAIAGGACHSQFGLGCDHGGKAIARAALARLRGKVS